MPNDGPRLLAAYRAMDAALVRAGWHATSLPWLAALERFWLSGKTRMVIRKGRQSGFSTTMERVDVCTGLYGDHRWTSGRRLALPNISITVSDAGERLYGIGKILDAIGVATRPSGDTIEVVDDDHPPIVFLTMACNFRTAVGLTAVAAVEDEMARWTNEDKSASPAREVDAAIGPMGVTQPNFRIYSGSSPLANEDFHAELVDRGETRDQCVFEGPSWYWNPTITEEATHRLQADHKIWSREFGGVPGAARSAALDGPHVERAFSHPMPDGIECEPRLILDPSSGKNDAFTFGAFGWVIPRPGGPIFRPYLRCHAIDSIGDSFWGKVSGDEVADKIERFAKGWGCRFVDSDQRESLMMSSACEKRGLIYSVRDWTAQSKPQAVERLRRWLAEGILALPQHDKLRREMLAFEERITPAGQFTFGARGKNHDDFVALLLTAAMSEIAGDLGPHVSTPWKHYDAQGTGSRWAVSDSEDAKTRPSSGERRHGYGSDRGFG